MHTHHYKTWGEAAGLPETAARLDRLPADLDLADDFPEPIHFDPAGKKLVYRGFMSSSSYAFLRDRCKDLAYLRALDVLFQQTARCRRPPPRSSKRSWWWLAAVGVAVMAAAAWTLLH